MAAVPPLPGRTSPTEPCRQASAQTTGWCRSRRRQWRLHGCRAGRGWRGRRSSSGPGRRGGCSDRRRIARSVRPGPWGRPRRVWARWRRASARRRCLKAPCITYVTAAVSTAARGTSTTGLTRAHTPAAAARARAASWSTTSAPYARIAEVQHRFRSSVSDSSTSRPRAAARSWRPSHGRSGRSSPDLIRRRRVGIPTSLNRSFSRASTQTSRRVAYRCT